MRAYVVTPYEDYIAEINSLDDYYKHLNCELMDVVHVTWNDEPISIFIDDEGLYVKNNLGRDVDESYSPLFGNLVIAGGTDNKGNTLSIPDSIIKELEKGKFISKPKYITNTGIKDEL